MDTFTPSTRARVRRIHKRARYDRETIHALLDTGLVCQVGYVFNGQPYVTTTSYWRADDRLYWHGSSASRMIRAVKAGIPVCFTMALFDGLVVARSGFHSSINYRSVTCFGEARQIEGRAAKLAALEAFSDRLFPGRWADFRPPNEKEIKATTVLGMEIEEAVAKTRAGPPEDDEEDYALDIWAGQIPVQTVIEAPIDDPRLRPGVGQPAYLKRFRAG